MTTTDSRRRKHLERLLGELDERLKRLTDTMGALDETAIVQIANLEAARSAVERLLKGMA